MKTKFIQSGSLQAIHSAHKMAKNYTVPQSSNLKLMMQAKIFKYKNTFVTLDTLTYCESILCGFEMLRQLTGILHRILLGDV